MSVHTEAVEDGDCRSVGDIFNPKESYGELETLEITEKTMGKKMGYEDPLASLFGDYSILGRSVTVSDNGDVLACCTIKQVDALM